MPDFYHGVKVLAVFHEAALDRKRPRACYDHNVYGGRLDRSAISTTPDIPGRF